MFDHLSMADMVFAVPLEAFDMPPSKRLPLGVQHNDPVPANLNRSEKRVRNPAAQKSSTARWKSLAGSPQMKAKAANADFYELRELPLTVEWS